MSRFALAARRLTGYAPDLSARSVMVRYILLMVTAALAGLIVAANPFYGLVLGLAGIVIVAILAWPTALVALSGLTLPFSGALVVRTPAFNLPAADIFAALGLVGLSIASSRRPDASSQRATRTLVLGGILYFSTALILAPLVHASSHSYLTTLQRIEIVGLWSVAGIVLARQGHLARFLTGYVVSCLVLSAIWIAHPGLGSVLGMQKNPSGGMIASAVLVVLLWRGQATIRISLLVVLLAGLISTGSRGSLIGLAAGIVVMLGFTRHWRHTLLPVISLSLPAWAIFNALPTDLQERITSQSAAGRYNEDIRGVFVHDALEQVAGRPLGIGVGMYRPRSIALQNIDTPDPHNVYVLAYTEGGTILFVAFLVLIVIPLLRLRTSSSSVVILAVAVQLAILAHSYVDVYWVRGTPALGWMLLGAALYLSDRNRQDSSHSGLGPPYEFLRIHSPRRTGPEEKLTLSPGS